ncbi:MAG: DUF2336 domain-containing protein [Alphaproteobacteria bacterium]|nr:DUF2336 domain-containing protein [Alphaproteobacteria bacterium]
MGASNAIPVSDHPEADQPEASSAPIKDVEELVRLARDKSRATRAALFAAIGDLYADTQRVLTEHDRMIMVDIIRRLIHEVEVSVRKTLAERFAGSKTAPRELVYLLANDEIEVACPLLIKSEALKDADLIEIVQQRTMEHQLAIAMRPRISASVSDALAATENMRVVTTLLSNQGAKISPDTMSNLVTQSRRYKAYQEPLSHRRDLTPDLARKLCWWVSAAVRQHIVEHFDIDPEELDDTIEDTARDLIDAETAALRREQPRPKKQEAASDDLAATLLAPLDEGDVSKFLDTFVKLTGLRLALVRRLVFEPGGEGLAIACKAIGVDQASFATILLRCRAGRLGDKRVEQAEATRAMSFYEAVEPGAARALVRRWHKDPEYLNALRMIDQASELSGT